MPAQYEAMRDEFARSMPYGDAQGKAARIYNSKHPDAPVTGRSEDKKKPPRNKMLQNALRK